MLDIDSAIKARAYEIWQARGEMPGHDLDDWLKAEGEIAAALTVAASPPRSAPPRSTTSPKPNSAAKATPQANVKARPKTRTRTGAQA
jgi:hypothetical protein